MKENHSGLSNAVLEEDFLAQIKKEAYDASIELIEIAKLKDGDLMVVGCSTSEVAGERIGSFSSPELGNAIFEGIYQATQEAKVYLAAQCCEHLNRALILEAEAAKAFGYEQVNVAPQPKAGGSFATAMYKTVANPVAVEHVKAAAGIDIGGTLIGMQLKEVAVPVRLTHNTIGAARLLAARTRPKFVGGVRACYVEELL